MGLDGLQPVAEQNLFESVQVAVSKEDALDADHRL